MSKARVAPLKGKWTIPRLELLAAVMASRISKRIADSFEAPFDQVFLYSDNSAVLGWIRDDPSRWKPFVANRIREIQRLAQAHQWSYVASSSNPADLLNRGTPLDSEELRSFWLRVPTWLVYNEEPGFHALNLQPMDKEALLERRAAVVSAASVATTSIVFDRHLGYWPKVVRVLAYAMRFLNKASGRPVPSSVSIDAEEFQNAEIKLIKNIQSTHFAAELRSNGEDLGLSSRLAQLNPFVGEDGLLRCRSRLERSSNFSYNEKFPAILPGEEFHVQLYIRWLHGGRCPHAGGVAAVLHHLRSCFFVTSARRVVNKALHGCKVCVRFRAKQACEPIPPLPAFRIEESPPFCLVAVDHAGPVYFKHADGSRAKAYILLFVCAVTRAVRLELTSDLSTHEFLLALRRFISRNPAVTRIVSDDAQTFKKADREINFLFDYARIPETQALLSRKRITWQYSTEKAPWFGGFWERLVQTIKRPLRKALGVHCVPFRDLETLLSEVEKMVNDRPLCAVISDPSEPRALSPSDLLYGYWSVPPLPDTRQFIRDSEAATAIVFSQRWRHQQSVLRGFWKQFQNQYLQLLRSAHYRKPVESRPLKEGDVCILHSTDASRAF